MSMVAIVITGLCIPDEVNLRLIQIRQPISVITSLIINKQKMEELQTAVLPLLGYIRVV